MSRKPDAGRHYCRNPRCGMKLPQIAQLDSRAFCCRGCHDSFYLHRCLVCEDALPPVAPGRTRRKLCRKAKCKAAFQRFGHLYTWPESQSAAAQPLSTAFDAMPLPQPIIGAFGARSACGTAIKTGDSDGRAASRVRGWQWRRMLTADGDDREDDDWELFDRNGVMVACVRQEGAAYWLARPRMVPEPPLEALADAMIRGEHVALSSLDWPQSERHPVHPGMAASQYQATQRDLDRKPAVVKISPVASVDHVAAPYRDDIDYLDIPDFLRRGTPTPRPWRDRLESLAA
jgi:hypothetical protein